MWFNLMTLILILYVRDCRCSRRVVLGTPSITEKGFMVYLIKSNNSNMIYYDNWICGGAIVSPTHILTAAACITDVTHIYAIAGYNKYVRTEYLDQDVCTKNRKQKVVKTCIPRAYKFNYGQAHRWIGLDIGFAIVEKPYNFSDVTYRLDCTYVPRPIRINYDPEYIEVHDAAVIYGWGHNYRLRMDGEEANFNSEYLKEASTRMMTKRECVKFFKDDDMQQTIEQYMICTSGKGDLDSRGKVIEDGPYNRYYGCRRNLKPGENCGAHDYDEVDPNITKKIRNVSEYIDIIKSKLHFPINAITINSSRLRLANTRRQGICQNDHGGPLVTWVGSREVVVGVASTSLHDEYHYCIAPSLFTSTHCSSRFLMCGLQPASWDDGTRRMCRNSGEDDDALDVHEEEIHWDDIPQNNDNSETMNKKADPTTTTPTKEINWFNPNAAYAREDGSADTNPPPQTSEPAAEDIENFEGANVDDVVIV